MEKYGTADRPQYNTAHALCMLDNYDYRRTLRILTLIAFHGTNGNVNAPQC